MVKLFAKYADLLDQIPSETDTTERPHRVFEKDALPSGKSFLFCADESFSLNGLAR